MKTFVTSLLLILLISATPEALLAQDEADNWIQLFDGETLEGWKASENSDTFFVEDGMIVSHGERSHLFFMGDNEKAVFQDFELTLDIKTMAGANSGIYFHTEYQESGWPDRGYEAQINNTYQNDHRRTGSLYGVEDITEPIAEDNEWFTMKVKVEGDQIRIIVDGEEVVSYTEPDNPVREDRPGRLLSSGTIALQGHDPESKVYFKNIKIRRL